MTPIHTRTITLNTIFTFLLGGILLALLMLYVVFQARLLIAGPQITITSNLNTIQTERQITLDGTADNITEIMLNDKDIVTTEDGHFRENIVLENGYNIITIRAYDRYGRVTILEKEFVYTPLSLLN